jgi:Bacterial SH3 domain
MSAVEPGTLKNRTALRTAILSGSVIALFTSTVFAQTVCIVNTSEIRLREKPDKKAHVIKNLRKGASVIAETGCVGGWVKVQSENGEMSGYVGGWALSPAFSTVAKTAEEPANTAEIDKNILVKAQAGTEIPSNEKLAIQITELRLRVISVENDMHSVKKEILDIKNVLKQDGAK